MPIADIASLRQTLTMSMMIALIGGGIFGAGVGLALRNSKLGCAALLVAPVVQYAYLNWWQSTHIENLRSTSALDIMFLMPLAGVATMVGFLIGTGIRYLARAKPDDF